MVGAASLKAVIFDADGTLFNTKELIMAAYTHVAQLHGLRPPTEMDFQKHIGKSLHNIYLGMYPEADPVKLVQANGEFMAANATRALAFDGLHNTLHVLKGRGLRLGILTGGRETVHEVLAHHEVAHFFDSVVHSGRIAKSKPDPEGVLFALDELGVQAGEATMVGDMNYDILAGKRAGVHMTIGLTHGFGSRESLEVAGADYIIDELAQISGLL
jgi:pyrophosphatase PpaX